MSLARNLSVVPQQTLGFKNRIINGGMVIDQRNAGASVTVTADNTYTVDRWKARTSQASKFSVQQNAGSVTPPTGFSNYVGVTSLSAYSVVAGDYMFLTQAIEGFNTADLGWGTANAKTVTLSFWVRSSLTGTFGGALNNGNNNRSYPFTYTVSSANTWTPISITIAGDTSGTWFTTNAQGIAVDFNLGTGSTYSGTAGVWAGAAYFSATGATSVVGTNGATFYITGVQLEVGSSATGFEYRQYGQELALCQRYLPAFSATTVNSSLCVGVAASATSFDGQLSLPVTTRIPATGIFVNAVGNFTANSFGTGGGIASNIIFVSATGNHCSFRLTSSSMTAGQGGNVIFSNTAGLIYLTGCEL